MLVCAADLPFVTPELIDRARRRPTRASAPAVVAALRRRTSQPLLGCYQPPRATAPAAPRAAGRCRRCASWSLRCDPRLLEVGDPELLFNVNAPEDLLHAAAMLDGRAGQPAAASRT